MEYIECDKFQFVEVRKSVFVEEEFYNEIF